MCHGTHSTGREASSTMPCRGIGHLPTRSRHSNTTSSTKSRWLRARTPGWTEKVNGRTLTYAYDELGRRVGRTTPGGAVSEWSYDAAGRRTKLTASGRGIAFSFDALGREVERTVSDFTALTSSFDEMSA
ncbi:RHS repeat domain-containing protein [Streptomyces sp. NPDC059835]|uniref:RHS repeat domain-containing protein n=1 Tax=Streptomyces sp. NPDC059835 TaxID=3346967 RepID=UPI00364A74BC